VPCSTCYLAITGVSAAFTGEDVDEVPGRIPEDHRSVSPGLRGGRQHPFDAERGDSRVLGVHVVDQEIEDDLALARLPAAGRGRAVILAVFGEPPLGETDRGRPGLDLDVVLVECHRHAQQPGVEPGQSLDVVGHDPALHEFHPATPRSAAWAA
jgi:hypothetical protein